MLTSISVDRIVQEVCTAVQGQTSKLVHGFGL